MKESLIIGGVLVAFGLVSGLSTQVMAMHKGVDHIQAGKNVYDGTCVACHGANGKGIMPGIPDFTKKASPLTQEDSVLFEHVKNGFESPGSFMAMPPAGGNPDLTDDQIRYVVEYLRKEFKK